MYITKSVEVLYSRFFLGFFNNVAKEKFLLIVHSLAKGPCFSVSISLSYRIIPISIQAFGHLKRKLSSLQLSSLILQILIIFSVLYHSRMIFFIYFK
jgi:hypothetical protein